MIFVLIRFKMRKILIGISTADLDSALSIMMNFIIFSITRELLIKSKQLANATLGQKI